MNYVIVLDCVISRVGDTCHLHRKSDSIFSNVAIHITHTLTI